jgi:hypothetical protein
VHVDRNTRRSQPGAIAGAIPTRPVDVLDLGNGVSLTVLDTTARPTGSSAVVQMRLANVSVRADGLIVRAISFRDIDDARAAAERLAQERG